ncbi:MAG: hypothetical protein J6386_05260 [Candidatus Synoicihabitans palmerolidicus]|nr:hypothetical protein [Candidatus Synoicihabitans palmerolidicus]
MQVPAGWSYSTNLGAHLVATRDGVALQSIKVQSAKLDAALPNSERELSPGLGSY